MYAAVDPSFRPRRSMMNSPKRFVYKCIAFLASLWALAGGMGCSDDEPSNGTPPVVNHPPQVEFTINALAVPKSTGTLLRHVTLSVDVEDQDQDPVTVMWKVTRDGRDSGRLNPAQQGQPSINWEIPMATGRDTITVMAFDAEDTTTAGETIQVGTLKETAVRVASETWSVADSPFIVHPTEDDFVIDERMRLTVEAGSELLIDRAGLVISVVGTLEANGTAQAPVRIHPNKRSPQPGDWQGITANPSWDPPVIRLSHTHLTWAAEAVKGNTTAEVHLDGCRIERASAAAVLHASSGELRVENSVITNNVNSGIKVWKIATPLPLNVVITGDTITLNGDLTGETPYVDQAGVYISMPDRNARSAINISGNEISYNGFPGIHLVGACYPVIHDNVISANRSGTPGSDYGYNIKLENGFGAGGVADTIDAKGNFWGGDYPLDTGEALIKEMIRDIDDGAGIVVRVLVVPWLHARP